jgi:hypothetical protein
MTLNAMAEKCFDAFHSARCPPTPSAPALQFKDASPGVRAGFRAVALVARTLPIAIEPEAGRMYHGPAA